jgi:MraZ protein
MLIGEYVHALDDKKRLAMPARLRGILGESVVVTPGLDGCLFLFTKTEWEKVVVQMSQFSMLDRDNRSFNRYLFGGAVEISLDASGRILIPETLRTRARLESKISIIGVQNRLELWAENIWNTYRDSVESEVDTLAQKLGSVGVV